MIYMIEIASVFLFTSFFLVLYPAKNLFTNRSLGQPLVVAAKSKN